MWLAWFLLVAYAAFGQSFEVVAIHPVTPGQPRTFKLEGGEMFLPAYTVQSLVQMIYKALPFQVRGGPDWASVERFDIHAKANVEITDENFYPMLRHLLAERFGLKIRQETEERRTYGIVVSDASKLKTAQGGARNSMMTAAGTDELLVTFTGFRIVDLIVMLSNDLEALVKDETGLTGSYDFEFTTERRYPLNLRPLIEKYGLRLDSKMAPVEIYIIESVSRPSEN